nr:unnamed protein product [Digitaria exilis]
MDRRLLEAASCGHAAEMKHLALHHPGVLLGTTPVGNTCLHIASLFGYEEFCKHPPSLLTATNVDGESR